MKLSEIAQRLSGWREFYNLGKTILRYALCTKGHCLQVGSSHPWDLISLPTSIIKNHKLSNTNNKQVWRLEDQDKGVDKGRFPLKFQGESVLWFSPACRGFQAIFGTPWLLDASPLSLFPSSHEDLTLPPSFPFLWRHQLCWIRDPPYSRMTSS
jgi:hypothetical protein